MSFILEALKKSEQKRQQQNTGPKKINKRILHLQGNPSGSRLFLWLVSGLLSLILFSGWWHYDQKDSSQTSSSEVILTTSSAHKQNSATSDAATNTPTPENPQPEIAKTAPPKEWTAPQPAITVEPAPVPRSLGATTTSQEGPLSGETFSTADGKKQTIETPVKTVVIAQSEPQGFNNEPFNPDSTRLPLYSDLSSELRLRIDPVIMSMHFYNKDPNRRLVRINDRLLHEGDWVNRDLQLLEITRSGAILEFLGKSFEMRSTRR